MGASAWQSTVLLLMIAGSLYALVKNRLVLSKLIVALGITLIAALQLTVLPIEKTIRQLQGRLHVLDEGNPEREKVRHNLERASERRDWLFHDTERIDEKLAKLELELKGLTAAGPRLPTTMLKPMPTGT